MIKQLGTATGGIAIALLAGCAKCDDCKKEKEVALSDLPAAVRSGIDRETRAAGAGAKVGDVEMETEDGKTVYIADVTINNEEWEYEFAADGTLIEKEREADEKGHDHK